MLFWNIAHAETPEIPASVKTFIGKISTEILNPIIAIMFAVATLYVFYGVARMVWNPEDEKVREEGRRAVFWGIIGMFIMVSVYGIMKLIINTIGADPNLMNNV